MARNHTNASLVKKSSKIVIVGAGVFGLSTALHLLRRGYTNIHIFDKQPYDRNHYSFPSGADAASADENKILRASYGNAKLYQDLAFSAMPEWQNWNDLVAASSSEELKAAGITPQTKLWNNCGYLRLTADGLESDEHMTQRNFPPEIKHTQYRISSAKRRADAGNAGIPASKLDPFGRAERDLPMDGILDMTAGFVLASRACAFALHILLRSDSVTAHLGPSHALESLCESSSPDGAATMVSGIKTCSGQSHRADLVVIACGGWTPYLLPSTENLLETTAGSVLSISIPPSRQDLWDKYAPENFPVWQWRMAGYRHEKTLGDNSCNVGGIYGLPRTPEGVVKIAFRGAKWTNYTYRSKSSGKALSYPKTDVDEIPAEAMRVLRTFCEENMPDLLELPLDYARLCWYTDSVDNSFLIDYVPGFERLMVASGGSGHGFKFLPVLGQHVVDVIERKGTEYTKLFSWQEVPKGKRNGLEEGPEGWRTLDKQKWAGKREWKL